MADRIKGLEKSEIPQLTGFKEWLASLSAMQPS